MTAREAGLIRRARENLSQLAATEGVAALELENARGHSRVAEAADAAEHALTRLLVVAKVYTDDAHAAAALDA